MRIASTVAPSFPIASSNSGPESPGSITMARSEPSARSTYVFSWNGPTVYARTSTRLGLPAAALVRDLLLAPTVEVGVGVVADRDVEQEHESAQRHRALHRLAQG